MADDDILIAEMTAPHGLDGSMRIKSFADNPQNLKRYKTFRTPRGTLTLTQLRAQSSRLIATFAEIADRTSAEHWRGTKLYIARTQLPPVAEQEFYQSDLIGMSCVSTDGSSVGIVRAIENYGAGDILDIALVAGGSRLVPFADNAVERVDKAARRIVLHAAYLSA